MAGDVSGSAAAALAWSDLRNLLQGFQQSFVIRRLIQRVDFSEYDRSALINDKYRPLADSRQRQTFSQDAKCLRDGGVGIEI